MALTDDFAVLAHSRYRTGGFIDFGLDGALSGSAPSPTRPTKESYERQGRQTPFKSDASKKYSLPQPLEKGRETMRRGLCFGPATEEVFR